MKKSLLVIPLLLLLLGQGCAPDQLPNTATSIVGKPTGSPTKIATTTIKLKNGRTFELHHPDTYTLSVAAEGYKRLRFMAKSPDNRLFVGEMFNASDTRKGHIYIFDEFDEKT